MSYEIRIVHAAEREMGKLPTAIHNRISRRILSTLTTKVKKPRR